VSPAGQDKNSSKKDEVVIMTAISMTIERNHRLIIAALAFIILFFLAACLFHDVIPICHFLFGCDHAMH
jgi:hypothetical protein